jgi:hypothetical protein
MFSLVVIEGRIARFTTEWIRMNSVPLEEVTNEPS